VTHRKLVFLNAKVDFGLHMNKNNKHKKSKCAGADSYRSMCRFASGVGSFILRRGFRRDNSPNIRALSVRPSLSPSCPGFLRILGRCGPLKRYLSVFVEVSMVSKIYDVHPYLPVPFRNDSRGTFVLSVTSITRI
jgi:hypothetical protein